MQYSLPHGSFFICRYLKRIFRELFERSGFEDDGIFDWELGLKPKRDGTKGLEGLSYDLPALVEVVRKAAIPQVSEVGQSLQVQEAVEFVEVDCHEMSDQPEEKLLDIGNLVSSPQGQETVASVSCHEISDPPDQKSLDIGNE